MPQKNLVKRGTEYRELPQSNESSVVAIAKSFVI